MLSPFLPDVLQTIAALQACPTSCIPSTSTAMLSPSLPFGASIPSVNLYPPAQTNPLSLQLDSLPVQVSWKLVLHVIKLLSHGNILIHNGYAGKLITSVFQTLLSNPSLLPTTSSAVEALANALFATTSRRASCPEPPATSQATVNLPSNDTLQVPTSSERRRYSETNLDVLIREQLAQMMPPTAQLPGMPGCYIQHVPVPPIEQARIAAAAVSNMSSSQRRSGQRKARLVLTAKLHVLILTFSERSTERLRLNSSRTCSVDRCTSSEPRGRALLCGWGSLRAKCASGSRTDGASTEGSSKRSCMESQLRRRTTD